MSQKRYCQTFYSKSESWHAADNHLSVHHWFVVLEPAAKEVEALLVETLIRCILVLKDAQIKTVHLGVGSPVAPLLDCLPQPLHCITHFTLLGRVLGGEDFK